jgi:hypothetical protein
MGHLYQELCTPMPRGVSASTFLESVAAGTAFVAAHRLRTGRTHEVSEKITGVTEDAAVNCCGGLSRSTRS